MKKSGFAQIFSRCPKNLSCQNLGGLQPPSPPPPPPPPPPSGPYAYVYIRVVGYVSQSRFLAVELMTAETIHEVGCEP